MKKLCISLAMLILFIAGCSDNNEMSQYQRQIKIEKSKIAVEEYTAAVKQAENNDPAGFLKLYKMAKDDATYTVEYSKVAEDELFLLLYSKPELWIKTFARVDLSEFKSFVKGIEVSRFPEGVESNEQFREKIFIRLEKIKGNAKEIELIDYIFGLYNQKRQQ